MKKEIFFSPREFECISHLAKGKTMKEIGRLLAISSKTVENLLTNAKNRANFPTTSNLIDWYWSEHNNKYENLFSIMQLSNVIQNMPCFIYWKDRNFVYLGCNDLTSSYLKLPSIIGKTDYDFGWEKEKVDAFRNVDEEVINTGKPKLNLEETIPSPDGKDLIYLLVNKKPVFDKNGKVSGIVGVSVDISERKLMEEELRIAKECTGHYAVNHIFQKTTRI